MIIGQSIQGSTSNSQKAIQVMVKYITKMESQITPELIEMLKLQIE